MKQLKYLDIRNTDINEVNINKLSDSLEVIAYSTELRPNCNLTVIVSQLEKYSEYGLCEKCGQTNAGKNWCQFCKEEE